MSNVVKIITTKSISGKGIDNFQLFVNGTEIEGVTEVSYSSFPYAERTMTVTFRASKIEREVLPNRQQRKSPPSLRSLFDRKSLD